MNEKRTLSFILAGNPVTKKNSQAMAVNRKTGKTFPVQSKSYKEYERKQLAALYMTLDSWGSTPCNLQAVYYMETHRKVDLCNLLAATCDILVKAGLLEDDNCSIVIGHDGSRVRYDKENPRVEITLTEVADEEYPL